MATNPTEKNPKQTTPKVKKNKKWAQFWYDLKTDNRFIFLCSLLLAFALWCVVSIKASPEVERTITNVPVTIDLTNSTPERLGLQMFGNTEFYVDVVIRGSRYRVSESMFSRDDLYVTANTSYVDMAGETQLSLSAKMTDNASDIEIVSLSRQTVTVYFDTLTTAVYTLEPELIFPDGVNPVPDGYLLDTPIASVPSVTVSGPASEVAKIKRVIARVQSEKSLTETTTVDAQIFMLTDTNASPNYCTCTAENVTVTAPVKKIVNLPVSVDYVNTPISYVNAPLPSSISPANVNVAVGTDVVNTTNTLSVGSIDYADIKPEVNTFSFNTADIEGVKILDSDLKTIQVMVDASSMAQKDFQVSISNVTSLNLPMGYSVEYDASRPVTVTAVGPETSLETLAASGIYAQVDYADLNLQPGKQPVLATFTVRTQTDCWCVGRYEIMVNVRKMESSETTKTN